MLQKLFPPFISTLIRINILALLWQAGGYISGSYLKLNFENCFNAELTISNAAINQAEYKI